MATSFSPPKPSNANMDLITACMQQNRDGIKAALERKANPNCTHDYGDTPLIYLAMYGGKAECAEILIEKGADPKIKNSRGRDAYFTAVAARNLSLMSYLEAHHLDTAIRDVHGLSSKEEASRLKAGIRN